MTKEHQPETARERDYTAMLLRQLRRSNMSVRFATEGELTRVMNLQNPRRDVNLLYMPDSTIYGWFDSVGIHITKAGLNANTLVHEYTHGFMAMLSLDNKPLYERIVKDLKDSPVWQEVLQDKGYCGITKDETRIASEVAARIAGNESELRSTEGVTAKVLRAIRDFWDYVQEKLGINHDGHIPPRRFTNMVMKDIVNLGARDGRLTESIDELAMKRLNKEKVNAIPLVLYNILEKEYGKNAAEKVSNSINAWVNVSKGSVDSTVLLSPITEELKEIAGIVGVSDELPNDELEYQCQVELTSLFDDKLYKLDISPYFQSELMVNMKIEEITNMEDNKKQQIKEGHSAEDRALETFTDLLITKIESMQSDWKKPWFTSGTGARWPKNASGREYNGGNALMLSLQAERKGYKLPVWMTFDRVNALNYRKSKENTSSPALDENGNKLPHVGVKKGEKGFPVFITVFNVVNPLTREKVKYDDWKLMPADERAKFNVYPKQQVYSVFNVDQTNIEEARPELYKKFVEQSEVKKPELTGEEYTFAPMDKMINEDLWICPIKPTYGDDAYYSISKHEIVVPEKSQFKDGESFYSNLFHEMNHSVHSEGYLNLLKPTSFGSKEYSIEELRAELGAAVVASRYGIVKNLKEDSAAYLKSWLDSIKEKPDFLKSILMDVKRSATIMTHRIDMVQNAIDEGRDIDRALFVANDYRPGDNIKEVKAAKMPGHTTALSQSTLESHSQTNQEQVTHGRSR